MLQLLLLGEEGAKGSTIFPLAQAPWAGLPSQAPQPRPLAPWPRPPSLGPTGPSLVKAGRMDGRTNGRMDGRTGIPPVFYRTSSPSGPLPCFHSNLHTNHLSTKATKQLKQGKGTDDHILPVGDWFSFSPSCLPPSKPPPCLSPPGREASFLKQ